MRLPLLKDDPRARRFDARTEEALGASLRADGVSTLQVNLGKRCNQACRHCHVDAGPARTESMSDEAVERVKAILTEHRMPVLDLTGGAPELHPRFRELVRHGRALGLTVIVRHNLTVMFEPGLDDLPEFFAEHAVALFCSLPHYTEDGNDRQRGGGVFEASVRALQRLNAVGYGTGRADRPLTLVHNPLGAFLPGSQRDLERDFRDALGRQHGVTFDRLVTLANMPIARFAAWLEKGGQLDGYLDRLEQRFNPATVPGLMCRGTVSVSWDGRLYDCDFNQMLDLPVRGADSSLAGFSPDALRGRAVVTGAHCFGCTAGSGSSCGGALAG
ncbi:MAG: arsenosugar biosynthesis radical SAM protein ArsS [Deltaproteobacteria bacterium]|nr:arsenosugar biosynthesis radical SAM protein ArsS [Myxococcales bacterium]MDP3218947.1 arsenosugar biosynthesis radical SAM protein ArsS [Deltaproteobacteria bacterium]